MAHRTSTEQVKCGRLAARLILALVLLGLGLPNVALAAFHPAASLPTAEDQIEARRPAGQGVQFFTATAGPGQVLLDWLDISDTPTIFNIWRADNAKAIGAVLVSDRPVVGAGGVFQFVDRTVACGQGYWYWLEEAHTGQLTGPQVAVVPQWFGRAFLPLISG